MDIDDSSPFNRPPPQQSGSVKKTARMPTPSARQNATAVGTEPMDTPIQQTHRAAADGIDAEHKTTHDDLPASSDLMSLPFRSGAVTANTQVQSDQADSDILHSDVYLSARKLLATTEEPDAHHHPPRSLTADANITHSHFSELLTRLMSEISAGGHDNLLPNVMLPGLAHLPINSSAFSTPVSSSTAQPFQFSSLPLDLQIRTLSFVPEADVALNCRLVCRELRNLVDGNETQIAQLVAKRELSRLRYQINLRKQMMSSNLTDFVFDAALWQKPSRLHSFSQPKALQQGALFALTDELKVNIFSYIPAQKVVSNLRATCQELCSVIDGHENKIADTIANRELRRLQAHSYHLKSFGPPASAKQFLESLRVFTEQRGMITSDQHASRVAARWVRHLFRNVFPYAANETGRNDKWAVLAKNFFKLQKAFAEDVRLGVPKRDRRQSFMQTNRHWDTASFHEIMGVYELVKASPTTQPYFPGTIHGSNVREMQT
ncbi:hypothetical protein Q7P35_001760 [Cladosporium inversicolor]